MVFFNWATMQMAAKIVYYGPGLCGKTTNLSFIYAKTSPTSRGEMVSLETESDRTLFFDLLPIEVGTIGGFKTRLQLYTVPGQVFYNTTRKLVLKGVDGVVFVADSQRPMREANIESFQNLRENLAELGLSVDELPVVLQYNKRDLKNVLTLDELNADLNTDRVLPFHEASALNGNGVFETLKEITKLTLKKLRRRMAAPQPGLGPRPVSGPVRPLSAVAPSRPATISAAALARAAEEGVEAGEVETAAPETAPPLDAPPDELPAADEHSPEHAVFEAVEAVEVAPAPQPEPAVEAAEDEVPEAAEATHDHDLEEVDELPPAVEADEPAPDAAAPEAPMAADEADHRDDAGDRPTPDAQEVDGTDPEMEVEFDQSEVTPVELEAPPLKRVQVSNQMDILAELDSLRKQATMAPSERTRRTTDGPALDLDALLGGPAQPSRELRRRLSRSVNSDIFARMRLVQIAVRIQDGRGDTLHTLDPIDLAVEDAATLEKLSLLLTLDLENIQ